MKETKLLLYSDGGARGNPGPAAIGIVLKNPQGEIVLEHGEYIGEQTNNVAEYTALLRGLELAKEQGALEVDCFLDSELVVKQLNKEYKVKDERLQKLFIAVWNISNGFKRVTYTHVRREQNTEADFMVNSALDSHLKN